MEAKAIPSDSPGQMSVHHTLVSSSINNQYTHTPRLHYARGERERAPKASPSVRPKRHAPSKSSTSDPSPMKTCMYQKAHPSIHKPIHLLSFPSLPFSQVSVCSCPPAVQFEQVPPRPPSTRKEAWQARPIARLRKRQTSTTFPTNHGRLPCQKNPASKEEEAEEMESKHDLCPRAHPILNAPQEKESKIKKEEPASNARTTMQLLKKKLHGKKSEGKPESCCFSPEAGSCRTWPARSPTRGRRLLPQQSVHASERVVLSPSAHTRVQAHACASVCRERRKSLMTSCTHAHARSNPCMPRLSRKPREQIHHAHRNPRNHGPE